MCACVPAGGAACSQQGAWALALQTERVRDRGRGVGGAGEGLFPVISDFGFAGLSFSFDRDLDV